MKRLRIYVDTSVIGGCLDREFEKESRRLFDEIRAGEFSFVLSATTARELEGAPVAVRRILDGLPPDATVAGADIVVSWNFKHIVHFEKIAGYNAVNLLNGYKSIAIFSPREVVSHDQEGF